MNTQTIQAVFEQGVLRPLQRLDLAEHARVEITIREASAPVARSESCYEVAQRAGIIGGLRGAPRDLSTNPDYLAGFGAQ